MTRNTRLAAAALALTTLLAAAPPSPPPPVQTTAVKAALRDLQGTWKIVRAENHGADVKYSLGYDEMIIEGTTTKVIYKGQEVKGSFEIDPAKKPRWITFTTAKGMTVPGIYELTGEHWKVLTRNGGRPEGWDAPGGALFEYERIKKSGTTQPATKAAG